MKEKYLLQKISQLETINDQLVAEIKYLNDLTKELGFNDGLKTLKKAAEELLKEQQLEDNL